METLEIKVCELEAINRNNNIITKDAFAAAVPQAMTGSIKVPGTDDGTFSAQVEQLKEAFQTLGNNVMGITTDAAVKACGAFSQALGHCSHAEGYYSKAKPILDYNIHRLNPVPLEEQDVFILGNENHILGEVEKDLKEMKWLDDTDE